MKTLAIASQKGGVGKSSTTAAINAGLRREGKKVLCVDMDSQANLSAMLGAKITGRTVYDILTGHSIRNAIQETDQALIIAGSPKLAEKGLLQGRNAEYRLYNALQPFRSEFDVCLIDCGPSLGTVTHAALAASDNVLIPCKADRFSLDALRQIAATVNDVKNGVNKRLTVAGVLVTMYERRLTVARLMREQIEKQAGALGYYVYPTAIRKCVAVEEAQITGEDIFSAGKNNAADDYGEIVKELMDQLEL